MKSSAAVTFNINGKQHVVSEGDLPITTTLAEYVRHRAGLTGTKIGCGEGGCGACTVVLKDAAKGVRVVNSCLRPLWSMDGMEVTTTEGIGSTSKGLHPVQ